MGYNTTVLVLNDALHEIENDPEFGKKLVAAIRMMAIKPDKKRIDITVGNHGNAVSVIETHHSSATAVVAMGGNYGNVLYLGYGIDEHHTKEAQWDLLEKALDASTKG